MEVKTISVRSPRTSSNFKQFKVDGKRTARTIKYFEQLSNDVTRSENASNIPQRLHFEICKYLSDCMDKLRTCRHRVEVGLYRPQPGAETFVPKATLFDPLGNKLKNIELSSELKVVKNERSNEKYILPRFCEQIDEFVNEALNLDKI